MDSIAAGVGLRSTQHSLVALLDLHIPQVLTRDLGSFAGVVAGRYEMEIVLKHAEIPCHTYVLVGLATPEANVTWRCCELRLPTHVLFWHFFKDADCFGYAYVGCRTFCYFVQSE